jgi:hypothetical protein
MAKTLPNKFLKILSRGLAKTTKKSFSGMENYCDVCGAFIPPGRFYCPQCGASNKKEEDGSVKLIHCLYCDEQNVEGSRFCVSCGKPLYPESLEDKLHANRSIPTELPKEPSQLVDETSLLKPENLPQKPEEITLEIEIIKEKTSTQTSQPLSDISAKSGLPLPSENQESLEQKAPTPSPISHETTETSPASPAATPQMQTSYSTASQSPEIQADASSPLKTLESAKSVQVENQTTTKIKIKFINKKRRSLSFLFVFLVAGIAITAFVSKEKIGPLFYHNSQIPFSLNHTFVFKINSVPSGAQVELNGRVIGTTPITQTAPTIPFQASLTLSKPGYWPTHLDVIFDPNHQFFLVPLQKALFVPFKIDPMFAKVSFLTGKNNGQINGNVLMLKPGEKYVILFTANGYAAKHIAFKAQWGMKPFLIHLAKIQAIEKNNSAIVQKLTEIQKQGQTSLQKSLKKRKIVFKKKIQKKKTRITMQQIWNKYDQTIDLGEKYFGIASMADKAGYKIQAIHFYKKYLLVRPNGSHSAFVKARLLQLEKSHS